MYAKCGKISRARLLFDGIQQKDVVSWTSMIDAYGRNGHGHEAVDLFQKMRECGMKVFPNSVTFLSVLSACGHSGLVEEGKTCFNLLREKKYGLEPDPEHYACFIDILGRAGNIEEVWSEYHNMVEQGTRPTAGIWIALLNACSLSEDAERGEFAAKHLLELEPNKASNIVLASNFYAAIGKWDLVDELRSIMRTKGLVKDAGNSWINVPGFNQHASLVFSFQAWTKHSSLCFALKIILTKAVADANKAIELNSSLSKAYLRNGQLLSKVVGRVEMILSVPVGLRWPGVHIDFGILLFFMNIECEQSIACMKLEEYQTAKAALETGASLAPGESRFANLIKECDTHIEEESYAIPIQEMTATPNVSIKYAQPENDILEQPTVTVSKPKYRHEFYQKPNEVVVTIFVKGIPKESISVDFGEQIQTLTHRPTCLPNLIPFSATVTTAIHRVTAAIRYLRNNFIV
ncbi:hypothetical protein RIF29_00379 [Crotalaria pallida]|uniref:Pentatricopeptide repeat protein n=1 Tax=Crotalaria pallida TaxID=3830 RepID=A0AAN9IWG1_CROPI